MKLNKNYISKRWKHGLMLPACLALASPAMAQNLDRDPGYQVAEVANGETSRGLTNPFSKLFSKREDPPEETPEPAELTEESPSGPGGLLGSFTNNRNDRNHPPRNEGKSGGGLLVPLKSFTDKVLQRTRPESDQEHEGHSATNRPSREFAEPFQKSSEGAAQRSMRGSSDSTVPFFETQRGNTPQAAPAQSLAEIAEEELPTIVKSQLDDQITSRRLSDANNLASDRSSNQEPGRNSSAVGVVKPIIHDPVTATKPSVKSSEASGKSSPPSLLDLSDDSVPATQPTSKPATGQPAISPPAPSKPATIQPVVSQPATSPKVLDVAATKEVSTTDSIPLPPPAAAVPTSIPASGPAAGPTAAPAQPVAPPKPANPSIDLRQSSNESTGSRAENLGRMQIPGVEVTVHGPDTLLVGQETMFEVVAKNQGATDLNGLLLRLSVPASVTLGQIIATDGGAETEVDDNEKGIVWELPSLPKNSHKSLRMMLTTENPEHFAMSVEWTAIPQSQQYAIQVQQPRLELAIEGASEAVYGVPQTYRVRIQNPGNAVAKNVELLLEASSFGSNTSNIGDILPGDDKTVEVEFLFQKGGVIPIVAKAVSSSSNVQAAAEVDVQVNQSTLTATIEGPETFYQGSSAEFVLTLQNTGLTSALETRCTLVLPEGTQRVQLPSGATLEGNSLVWNAGEVAANQTLQIPLSLAFEKTGTNDLRLEATTISGSKAEAKHSLEVDAIIDLQLIVHDPSAPAPVGKDVYYDLEILNRGRKRASSVNVLVQFSEGIEPIRTEGHEARLIPGQVIFNNIPQIEPGQSIKLRVIAEASQAGVHRFRVEVKSDNGEADLLQEASTRYLNSTNPRR